jgi:hypothetical protein
MRRTPIATNRIRRGVLKSEALLGMLLLVSAMSFASTLVYRINHLWNDSRSYQFATNELANQLQQLVQLSPEDAAAALKSISPGHACKETLREPKLVGVLAEDTLGTRVTLQLTWKQRGKADPIMLSAWLKNGADGEESQ